MRDIPRNTQQSKRSFLFTPSKELQTKKKKKFRSLKYRKVNVHSLIQLFIFFPLFFLRAIRDISVQTLTNFQHSINKLTVSFVTRSRETRFFPFAYFILENGFPNHRTKFSYIFFPFHFGSAMLSLIAYISYLCYDIFPYYFSWRWILFLPSFLSAKKKKKCFYDF